MAYTVEVKHLDPLWDGTQGRYYIAVLKYITDNTTGKFVKQPPILYDRTVDIAILCDTDYDMYATLLEYYGATNEKKHGLYTFQDKQNAEKFKRKIQTRSNRTTINDEDIE